MAVGCGLAAGLVGWFVTALDEGFLNALDIGFGTALASAFGAMLVLGLTYSVSHQQRNAVTPLSAFRTDIKATLVVGGLVAVVTCLICAIAVVAWPDAAGAVVGIMTDRLYEDGRPAYGYGALALVATVELGLVAGLGSILWLGLRRSATWWYGIAVPLLTRQRTLPTRPLQFLEDAYRRGVMRQAGMVYEFRHVRLAEHLRLALQHGRE